MKTILLPLPLNRLGQDMIEIIDIVPVETLVDYPRTDGKIACPLLSYTYSSLSGISGRNLTSILRKSENMTWKALYTENTLPTESIYYNEEMKDLAGRIVGEEKKPYLQARLLYDFVVENTSTALLPKLL